MIETCFIDYKSQLPSKTVAHIIRLVSDLVLEQRHYIIVADINIMLFINKRHDTKRITDKTDITDIKVYVIAIAKLFMFRAL